MGPHVRCEGTDVPPPQEFQLPLPDAPEDTPSYTRVKWAIGRVLDQDPSYRSLFVTLAYRCAATFRGTDLIGGCNGARIRFPPQSEWEINTGLDQVRTRMNRDSYCTILRRLFLAKRLHASF